MSDLFLGDVHLGARNGSSTFRELITSYLTDVVIPHVKKNKIKRVIQLGDFFDNRNHTHLADISFVLTVLRPAIESCTDTEWYFIAGNHDIAFRNTNKINSLALFAGAKNIHVVDNNLKVIKTESKTYVLCPWINSENSDQLLSELKKYKNKDHILFGHFEFSGMKMYRNSKLSDHGLNPTEFKDFYAVYSGHFHHVNSSGVVHYLGSVFHLNWQDYGDKRYIWEFDHSNCELTGFENELCLFTAFDYHEELLKLTDQEIEEYSTDQFVRIYIYKDYDRSELKLLVDKIQSYGPLKVEVIDETIFEKSKPESDQVTESVDGQKVDGHKTVKDYAVEYFGQDDKESIALFEEIHKEAQTRMKSEVL